MKSINRIYEATMVHDDDTIRLMFKTEYYTYERVRLLLRYALAFALVAAALLFGLPTIPQALCLAVGAWLFVTPDFPSKVRAEGVIAARNGQKSSVTMRFDAAGVEIGNGVRILYAEIDRLIEDERYFYIFRDKQTAVMTPKNAIVPDGEEAFSAFIEEKTGKKFESNKSFLNMNLKDLAGMIRREVLRKP